MAHSNNVISSIKLPNGNTYEIHDAKAIHNVEELGLAAALVFKGTKSTEAEVLALTSAKVGDVYLCTGTGEEFVCIKEIQGTANADSWERLGNIHNAASAYHTHTVTVTGTNKESAVTGTVVIPTVSKTSKYMKATATPGTVTPSADKVLGADTTFAITGGGATTTKLSAKASGGVVSADGTVSAVTGYANPTTDTALGTNATFSTSGGTATKSKMVTTTIKNPTTLTEISVPNVTSNTEVSIPNVTSVGSRTAGTAASWGATVNDEVLTFSWTANTPTAVTMPTLGTAIKATNTVLGTANKAHKVTTTDATVATGALSTSGSGAEVATDVSKVSVSVSDSDVVTAITGLGTASTKTVLTGVKMEAQPTITISTGTSGDVTVATGVNSMGISVGTNDRVDALTGVTVAAPTVTLSNDGTSSNGVAFVDTVSIGSTNAEIVNGKAAAQEWT